jgi:hypothetical protein
MSGEVEAQRPAKAPVAEPDKVVVRNLNFYYVPEADPVSDDDL